MDKALGNWIRRVIIVLVLLAVPVLLTGQSSDTSISDTNFNGVVGAGAQDLIGSYLRDKFDYSVTRFSELRAYLSTNYSFK